MKLHRTFDIFAKPILALTAMVLSSSFLMPSFAAPQNPAPQGGTLPFEKPRGQELVSNRTLHSKTYLNPEDNTLTTVASTGYIHYQDNSGRFHDLDRRIVFNADQSGYEVRAGLYFARFPLEFQDQQGTFVGFETRDTTYCRSKLLMLAYYDRQAKRLVEIQKVRQSKSIVDGNTIHYSEVFVGVDAEYEYGDTRLKQHIYLNQNGRKHLPDPQTLGLNLASTDLVLVFALQIPDEMEAFANNLRISAKSSNHKIKLSHEGEETIEFRDKTDKPKFRLIRDVAFIKLNNGNGFESTQSEQPMWRRFYQQGAENFVLTGVPLTWVNQQQEGTIVLDPTVSLANTPNDAYIYATNPSTNYGSNVELRIGNHSGVYRSLIQFDLTAIPTTATITNADMKLFYSGTTQTPISRTIECHQVLKSWSEIYITWNMANLSLNWNTPGVGLNDIDANDTAEDAETWYQDYGGWKTYNITALTQKWVSGAATNLGVVLRATNQSTGGEAKTIHSSEYTTDVTKRPKLEITYKLEPLAEYKYDAQGRPDTVTYANGVKEINQYNQARGWITRRDYKKGSSNLFYFINSIYDNAGNLKQQKYKHTTESEKRMDYVYDNLNRLKEFKINGTTNQTYSYDDNGNFKTFAGRTFAYGNKNNQMTNDAVRNYVFDQSGRVKQIGTTNLTYDIFNNMLTHGSDNYKYDDASSRLRKTEASVTTYYISDELATLAEYNGTGQLLAEYIYDDRGVVTKFDPARGHYWYYKDHLGSTRRLDPSSMKQDYYPFGEDYVTSGSETNYRFTGKELDNNTGLYYYGARYYDRRIGRWLVRDPFASKYPALSPYNYSLNNPGKFVDLKGGYAISVHYKITFQSLQKFGYADQIAKDVAHMASVYADHPSENIQKFEARRNDNNDLLMRKGTDMYSATAGSQNDDLANVVRHAMRSSAMNDNRSASEAITDGLRFGWDHIWKAAQSGVSSDITSSFMSNFGVGLHALQDAYAHEGATMDEHLGYNFSSAGRLLYDAIGSTRNARRITESAIIVLELLKGTFSGSLHGATLDLSGMSSAQFNQIILGLEKLGYTVIVDGMERTNDSGR